MFAALNRVLALLFVVVTLTKADTVSAQIISEPTTFLSVEQSYGLTAYVNIEIGDEVVGGCWTNANSVRERARLKFEQNDVDVIDYKPYFTSPFTYYVLIVAVGFRTDSGLCAGFISVENKFISNSRYGEYNNIEKFLVRGLVTNFSRVNVITNSTNFNNQISDFVDRVISELVAKITSARRDPEVQRMKSVLPKFLDTPLTEEQIDEITSGN